MTPFALDLFVRASALLAAAALLGMDAEPLSDEEYKRLSALLRRRREGGTR